MLRRAAWAGREQRHPGQRRIGLSKLADGREQQRKYKMEKHPARSATSCMGTWAAKGSGPTVPFEQRQACDVVAKASPASSSAERARRARDITPLFADRTQMLAGTCNGANSPVDLGASS